MTIAAPPQLDAEAARLRDDIVRHLRRSLGKAPSDASRHDQLMAAALAVRDRMAEAMIETEAIWRRLDAKRVYYLSMEFLIGRSLGNNLTNLGLFETCARALAALGADIDEVRDTERDAALGNGGLGRLAACFLDSMATLGIPGFGYGINFEYGLFRQEIVDGYQVEAPDDWLAMGTPWQLARPDEQVIIPVYGHLAPPDDGGPEAQPRWVGQSIMLGVPFDMPIAGYGGATVNYLRLYAARSAEGFDVRTFNAGDYAGAVMKQIATERISKVLYPSDTSEAGRELRLLQEYFFTACALRDIVRRYLRDHIGFEAFPDKVAIQLNDTHPAIAVAELMRLLVDEHGQRWDRAWNITQATLAYTNHTLQPEALETWPVPLMDRVLPRHMDIIRRINQRFLDYVARVWPGDIGRLQRTSIIEEGPVQQCRMANLAIIGSHSVNGVAELHTQLLKSRLVPDFADLWPEKFSNKTNGITQRRWLLSANRRLSALISEAIGTGWITDLDQLRQLEPLADDPVFRERFRAVKLNRKRRLEHETLDLTAIKLDIQALFDVQAKRIHEYKRQLLNLMHVVHLYLRVVEDGDQLVAPRACLFAGKAAPSYTMAKLIIKLINSVAAVVNADPAVRGQLRVAFLPDYRVSLARSMIPAADLSEQISTAGKEASGTGNMKFALNGALTIGTLDGANIEIRDEVGPENIIMFGLTATEVDEWRARGYRPRDIYEASPAVRRVVDAIASDRFCGSQPGLFAPIVQSLLDGDPYFHLADFEAYVAAQERVSALWLDRETWTRMAILNVARIGKFSSDRSVREYARDIWGVPTLADR